MPEERPLYLLAADILRSIRNHNYGLAEQAAADLWELLLIRYRHEQEQEEEKSDAAD